MVARRHHSDVRSDVGGLTQSHVEPLEVISGRAESVQVPLRSSQFLHLQVFESEVSFICPPSHRSVRLSICSLLTDPYLCSQGVPVTERKGNTWSLVWKSSFTMYPRRFADEDYVSVN